MSDKLLQQIREKFEWYRMALPKREKEAFDRILEKPEGTELSIAALPGDRTAAVLMNRMIDAEERMIQLENRRVARLKSLLFPAYPFDFHFVGSVGISGGVGKFDPLPDDIIWLGDGSNKSDI